MYQHILVPVDGSTTSDRALQEALKLARQQSAQLELVHVVEDMRLWIATVTSTTLNFRTHIKSSGNKILAQAQMVVQLAGMVAEVNCSQQVANASPA